MSNSNWVDFKELKSKVGIFQVLEHYNVNWLRKEKDSLRGRCPIHKGEGDRSFHVSLSKNAFHCFSCEAKGNIFDFVIAMENVSLREAALKLSEWFQIGGERGESRPAPTKKNGPAKERKESDSIVQSGKGTETQTETKIINPPLTFQLKVDMNHDYGKSRGLSQETVDYFGAGLCLSKSKTFGGRWVVPLHDPEGRLIGYAGRLLTDDEDQPKYLFPPSERGFHKSHLLFNLHRVLKEGRSAEPVMIVEGFFDVMKLQQAGYPSVGLLGCSLSQEQEILIAKYFQKAILMFDGDDAGKRAEADCLDRLSRRVFVKVVSLPQGKQPDMLSTEQLVFLLKGEGE